MAGSPRGKHTSPQRQQRKAERAAALAKAREEARKAHERTQKRAARRQALKSAGVTFGVLAAVIAAGAAVAVFVLIRNHPTRVTGSLHGVRDISFVEGVQHDSGVSPVCGCEHPPLDEWRGVTFGARALTLTRTGRSPWTEWELQSASDAPFWDAGEQPRDWLTVTAVQFKTDKGFDPRWMLSGMARHVTVLSERRFGAYRFLLLDHRPLHVAMLGPVPLAAWVPFPGSRVSLHSQPSSFTQDPSIPTLTETYPPSVGTFAREALGQGYPVGDFMLPDLVLWVNDPTAQIPLTPLDSPAGPRVMTALLFPRSTFSLAVSADPLDGQAYRAQLHRDAT